jgi:hypothetical protein
MRGYRGFVNEAEAVLERLARIEALDRAGVGRGELLTELRALLEEAEAWSKVEGGGEGEDAVTGLREALARTMPRTASRDIIAV